MTNKKRLIIVLSGLACLCQPAFSAPTVSELVTSMTKHHPYVFALEEKAVQADFSLDIAQSAFDPTIEQDFGARVSGYYDGTSLAQRYVQPLSTMNAKVFTSYRISEGDFPVYEEQYQTLSGGEASVGMSFSLLRNREADKRRTGLLNAELERAEASAYIQYSMNSFLSDGLYNYLAWYESAAQERALRSQIAVIREQELALATRVSSGDLAEVALVEFQSTLLEQTALLAKLEQKKLTSARALSFFWRDSQGKALEFDPDFIADIDWPFSVNNIAIAELKRSLDTHPSLLSLQIKQSELENKAALVQSELLPMLDAKVSVSRDIGSGPLSLEGTESKVGLTFSYTLGNRKAQAEVRRNQSQLNEVELTMQVAQERLTQEFEQAVVNWQQATRVAALLEETARVAGELAMVERRRFVAGDVDMFVVNARVTKEIQARMKAIQSQVDVYRAELALFKISAQLRQAYQV